MSGMHNTRLRQERERQQISQTEAASAVGIGRPFLSDIEAGKKDGSFKTIVALAEFYKVSLDYLAGFTGSALEADGELVKDATERSLLRMWRAMNEGERHALAAVASRLADKADGSDAA